jgi:hypothetical protein
MTLSVADFIPRAVVSRTMRPWNYRRCWAHRTRDDAADLLSTDRHIWSGAFKTPTALGLLRVDTPERFQTHLVA